MKLIITIILFWGGIIHAASTKNVVNRNPSNEPAKAATTPAGSVPSTATTTATTASSPTVVTPAPAAPSSPLLVSTPLDPLPLIHLSTNLVDLTQGKSNFLIDFFNFKKKFQVNFRSYSSAEQESVDKNGTKLKLTVNRSALGIGFSWYAYDINSAKNWVLSPALVFGKTDDSLDTTSQAGIGLKATALFRVGDRMTFEAGLLSDTIHTSHRTALHFGIGYYL